VNAAMEKSRSAPPGQPAHLSTIVASTVLPWSDILFSNEKLSYEGGLTIRLDTFEADRVPERSVRW